MNNIFLRQFVLLLLSILPISVLFADTDLGAFVTQSDGEIEIEIDATNKQQLPAFAKIYSGTRIQMGPDSKLQLVYLESGQQESWTGPAELEIGQLKSTGIESGGQPTTKTLPPAPAPCPTFDQPPDAFNLPVPEIVSAII